MEEPPRTGILDTADVIGLDTPDPAPEEITDPDHADYVEPFEGATVVPALESL